MRVRRGGAVLLVSMKSGSSKGVQALTSGRSFASHTNSLNRRHIGVVVLLDQWQIICFTCKGSLVRTQHRIFFQTGCRASGTWPRRGAGPLVQCGVFPGIIPVFDLKLD